jgi:hypothetical protein
MRWRPRVNFSERWLIGRAPSALDRLLAGHEGGRVGSHDRGCRSQRDPQHCGSG